MCMQSLQSHVLPLHSTFNLMAGSGYSPGLILVASALVYCIHPYLRLTVIGTPPCVCVCVCVCCDSVCAREVSIFRIS